MPRALEIGAIAGAEPLAELTPEGLMPLPAPYDTPGAHPPWKVLQPQVRSSCECSVDGFTALGSRRAWSPGSGRSEPIRG